MSGEFSFLVEVLPALATVACSMAAFICVHSFVKGAVSLLLQARVSRAILARAEQDFVLRDLIARADQALLDSKDEMVALKAIEAASESMSVKERAIIAKGMNQPSVLASKRYIRDLVSCH